MRIEKRTRQRTEEVPVLVVTKREFEALTELLCVAGAPMIIGDKAALESVRLTSAFGYFVDLQIEIEREEIPKEAI